MLLNCSKRSEQFHPAQAKVEVGGYLDTIENHTMLARRILKEGQIVAPQSLEEVLAYPTVGVVVRGKLLPFTYYPQYVGLLWHKYLKQSEELMSRVKRCTEFRDYGHFKDVSHAEIIAKFAGYEKPESEEPQEVKGAPGELLLEWCAPLRAILKREEVVLIETERALTESINEVIGFFYCVDQSFQEQTPEFYQHFCKSTFQQYKKAIRQDASFLIGSCFVRKNQQSNLERFKSLYTKNYRNQSQSIAFIGLQQAGSELEFKTALSSLKNYAKERNLAVSLPYHLGLTVTDTDDWQLRLAWVKEMFADYYVTLHQKL